MSIPTALRVPLLRSALVTWVCIWATARVDSALLLLTWILLGSAATGVTRTIWLAHPVGGIPVDLAQDLSFIVGDTLGPLQALTSFIVALGSLAALAHRPNPDHHISKTKRHNTAGKAAWLFFVISRILLPISLASCMDDPISLMGYLCLMGLSFTGPLASWPARCFVFADAVYSLTTLQERVDANTLAAGTEAAVVAACLCFAHDAAAKYFMFFLEEAAFTMGLVFIGESTIVVFRQPGFTEGVNAIENDSKSIFTTSWAQSFDVWAFSDMWTWLVTKAPPMVLTLWALGMHARTFTQGRVNAKEFGMCTILAMACGAIVLVGSSHPALVVTRPIFASVICVAAMFFSSRIAEGRKSVLGRNRWFVATGAFRTSSSKSSRLSSYGSDVDDEDVHGDDNDSYVDDADAHEYQDMDDNNGVVQSEVLGDGTTNGRSHTVGSSSNLHHDTVVITPSPTLDELRYQLQETIRLSDLWRQNMFRLNAMSYGMTLPEDKAIVKANMEKATQTIKELDELAARRQLEIVKLMSGDAGGGGGNDLLEREARTPA